MRAVDGKASRVEAVRRLVPIGIHTDIHIPSPFGPCDDVVSLANERSAFLTGRPVSSYKQRNAQLRPRPSSLAPRSQHNTTPVPHRHLER
jgi:hypothetical protein